MDKLMRRRPIPDPIQNEAYFMPSPQGYMAFSVRDFLYVLFRHKWKIILFFLVVVATITVSTLLSKEIYRSEAKLMVRLGRESVALDPTATTGQVMHVGQSRESELNSELEILKSRELVQKVVDTIGSRTLLGGVPPESSKATMQPGKENLKKFVDTLQQVATELKNLLIQLGIQYPLTEREKAIVQFIKNYRVEVQKNSNILFISYEGPGHDLSQITLTTLINFYLEKHSVMHRTSGSHEFFNNQTDQIRNQVAKVEEELLRLKSKTGVASLEDQRRILMNRIGSLQQESESTQAALSISQAKIQELKKKLADLSPTLVTQETKGTGNYAADLMRARLYELQLKEQDLLSKYTENSKLVQEVRRQIQEAQALLAKEEPTRTQVTTGINTAYQDLNLELIKETATLSSLGAKSNILKTQLEAARREITELNNTEFKMVGLQRDLNLLEAKYRKYAENLEQTRVDQALLNNKISNISVVQAPTTLPEPVKPRKALNVVLGIILGILGGIGLGFCWEWVDHSLKTPRDIEEKLKLPILASIPVLKK
jgi:uncharacterized protein involved in exopolysaccharide biosynthesis